MIPRGVDVLDVGLGQVRRLTGDELASFEGDPTLELGESDIVLARVVEAHWTVTATEPRRSAPLKQHQRLDVMLPALLLMAGCRDGQSRLRVPHVVWDRHSPYFFHGGSRSGGSNPNLLWRSPGTIYGTRLSTESAARAKDLQPHLLPPGVLDVAIERLVAAAQVYDQPPGERLVDAAVAWEAMFGSTDHNQLSLQLVLGLAWLLHPDDFAARQDLHKSAKKIYGLRSTIVHGGTPKLADVANAAEVLIEWIADALRELCTTHRSLAADKDRTRRLLLRDPDIAGLAPI